MVALFIGDGGGGPPVVEVGPVDAGGGMLLSVLYFFVGHHFLLLQGHGTESLCSIKYCKERSVNSWTPEGWRIQQTRIFR